MNDRVLEIVGDALDKLNIEIPSWGFANTGTRFGKFLQAGAATTLEEKFADAAQVHKLTGITPSLALHVLWDLPRGLDDVPEVKRLAQKYGVRAGSINPNLFQDQEYKFGSLCNPDAAVRRNAVEHVLHSVEIARALGCRDISLWLADGSNYPGAQSIRHRIAWLEEALEEIHQALAPDQRLLIEYKPFEPAFYHTDIADWGMAAQLARAAGPKAQVLVDTGHHYQSQNIEQIVAWLLHLGLLGGFHFNDRRYADDDLTLGSIDPYQVFRIFHEILFESETNSPDVAFMLDQSHNVKGKIEATLQTVCTRRNCTRARRWSITSDWRRYRKNARSLMPKKRCAGRFGSTCGMPCANGASPEICRSIRYRNSARAVISSESRQSDRIGTRREPRVMLKRALSAARS